MTSQEQLRDISGAIAYDRAGNKLGKIGQVCYDDDTDLATSRRGGLAVLAPAMSAQSFLTWDSVDGADWRVAPSSRAPEGARNA